MISFAKYKCGSGRWLTAALLTLSFSQLTAGETWHTVSVDNFGGSSPRVIESSGTWRIDEQVIPLSVCTQGDPARSLIFGNEQVKFKYHGLRKEARYRLKLTFLSDAPTRAQAVLIDGKLVRERFVVPTKEVRHLNIDVAEGMILDGEIIVTIEKRDGPNAVISQAELLSTLPRLEANIHAEFYGKDNMITGHLSDLNALKHQAEVGTEVTAELKGEKVTGRSDKNGNFSLVLPPAWLTDPDVKIKLSVKGSNEAVTFKASRLKEKGNRKTVLDTTCDDPFELAIAKDGRVFYIERRGAVKMCLPDRRASKTLATLKVYTKLDDGLLGLALDPDFMNNNWMYLCYSHLDSSENVVSRFTLKGDKLDLSSEKIILRIPVQRDTPPCHTGGSLAFDSKGNLFISTGDNILPFESDGSSPSDERPGREVWDAQASSADTNDLRGKVLRITPQKDGTYSIPEGNLFAPGTPKTRPEIYVMGCRNPFRISVDPKNSTLYWGDVGPDAGGADPKRGPAGHDEINQASSAGNYGWPHFVADNKAYVQYDFATKESGKPWVATKPFNRSRNNKGLVELPSAKPAFIWYPYSASSKFPELGSGGRCAMAGPVYYFDPSLDSTRKLPKEFDHSVFIYDWMRGWIYSVKLDKNEKLISLNRFMPKTTFKRPMDLELGPDGALYLIEWGSNYGGGNADAQIVRLDIDAGVVLENIQDAPITDNKAELLAKFKDSLHGGDASRGEAYFKSPKGGCVYCHKIGDNGGLIGPALDGIGKQLTRQELLEAVILPNEKVAPKYLALVVQMKNGITYTGTAKSESDEELQLDSPEVGIIKVKKADIKEIIKGRSPMPDGMGAVMTPNELSDLIEYMMNLK